tara:strand:+ start:556 stop:852 length:297 start_codon:yes stop_codon:yes gene_type:complete
LDTSPSHFTSHEKLKPLELPLPFPPFEIRPSLRAPSAEIPKRKAFVASLNVSSTSVTESLSLELQSLLRDETVYSLSPKFETIKTYKFSLLYKTLNLV